MNTLGTRIKKYRKLKGLTQKQLANLIGAKHNSVCDWEKDRNVPYPETIELLCGVFEIDANTLLEWDDPNRLREDAEVFAKQILNNKSIKDILPMIVNLSDDDVELVKNFIQRLAK